MLMSKSRLEKFLYALYSLDSSDLPKPLSRIEELYSCLVTGDEAPTFEPISRVEKYLMAILGGYDVELLPNPLSRVEVLLYKLATGDDNLDDVNSFLSEHEELLAEIIRNGGAGGNIDIEYVLYTLSTGFNTLYNTAKKPVKSAILKGNTLINIKGNEIADFKVVLPGRCVNDFILNPVKDNTQYLIMYDLTITDTVKIGILRQKNTKEVEWTDSTEYITSTNGKIILNSGTGGKFLRIISTKDNTHEIKHLTIIEYQNGMENWDIPYFEGMQSVKMPVLTTTGKNFSPVNSGSIKKHTGVQENYKITDIKLAPNEEYTISFNSDISTLRVFLYDETGTEIFQKWEPGSRTFQTNECENYYLVIYTFYDGDYTFSELQIEQGSVATPYEPYKSNILTVNEEVELRGIDDVKDELNVLTGELTQRIGEIVLDGSNDQFIEGLKETKGDYLKFGLQLKPAAPFDHNIPLLSDNMNTETHATSKEGQQEQIYIHSHTATNTELRVCILPSKLQTQDANGFNLYLSENPITVQYPLASESVKTVDLSVVDQDGNNTKLSTFNDLTHVTLSSEGLIPEAELEVATKNEEVLNTLSLEMDDISTTQTTLRETTNTQSENVDATMIATTEIYEGLL